MLRHALRLQRWGMVGFGFTFAVATLVNAAAYSQVAGSTAASRAEFARSMSALAPQVSYLYRLPYRLDTLAGYVQWRAYGAIELVVAVWAIVAAVRAARGDEEKGLIDSWLAAGISRPCLILSRLTGFGAAALVAAVGAGLGTLLGGAGYESISLARVAGATIALWLLMVTCFALCYLAAQLPAATRGAQGVAGAFIVLLYLLNAAARSQPSLGSVAWISPFKWYDATDVLAPGGRLNAAGVALSIAVTLGAAGLAALAFARRDVGGGLFARAVPTAKARDVPPSLALGWPVARLLYRQRGVLLAWALATVVLALFMVSIARTAVDSLIDVPGMRDDLARLGSDPYQAFIALFWFGIAQLLLAGFAIHLISGWASDDTEGVLEAVLSMPQQRSAVVIERAATAVVGVVVVVVVGSVTAALAAAASGTALDAAGVVRASWLLVPFALTFAAVGAVGSAWWPRAAVGVLALLAFVSFLIWEMTPLMGWPQWVGDLSVFQLYGTPLSAGIFWTGLWAMLGIVVAGFGGTLVAMRYRDVGA